MVPCFLHEWCGRRQLTLLGSGVSDYLDPVFDPCHTPEIIERVGAELRRATDWDICDWQDLSADSPLQALGESFADTPCSVVRLEGSFEDFLAARSKDLRRNLRRYRERAEAVGPVSFEAVEEPDAELMDSLVRMHGERWAAAGERGMFESNGSAAFTREAAEKLASRGAVRMFTVRFLNRSAAMLLAFRHETALFCYMSAFDPRHQALGFGRELLAQTFRHAHVHGYKQWNFLRGEEHFKFSWGATAVPKRRVRIVRYGGRIPGMLTPSLRQSPLGNP